MAKTNITAYDMQELFKTIFTENDYDLIIFNENTKQENTIKISEYLETQFYTYVKDLRDDEYEEDGYGFNFPNFDEWVNSRGTSQTLYAHVELSNLDIVASEDIDMGGATANITFVCPIDKADILESHLSKIRLNTLGKRYEMVNSDGLFVTYYNELGELKYNDYIDTPFGKCVNVDISFGINFIQGGYTSNQSNIEISLNGVDYEKMLYNQSTDTMMFTNKPNIMFNKPYASGIVNSSVSYNRTFTYWIFTRDNLQLKLNSMLKKLIDDNYVYTEIDTINIPVWIRERIPTYDDDGILTTETITTLMTVANYTVNQKNSDFVNVSLSLARYGKVR